MKAVCEAHIAIIYEYNDDRILYRELNAYCPKFLDEIKRSEKIEMLIRLPTKEEETRYKDIYLKREIKKENKDVV